MKISIFALLVAWSLFALPGCSAIEGIFKAGVWVGILAAAVVVGVIIWIATKSKK